MTLQEMLEKFVRLELGVVKVVIGDLWEGGKGLHSARKNDHRIC